MWEDVNGILAFIGAMAVIALLWWLFLTPHSSAAISTTGSRGGGVSQRIWHGVYGLCCGALCGGVIMLMMPQHFGLSLVSVPILVMGLALAVIGFCSGIHFVEYVYATGMFLAALVPADLAANLAR
jgi:hypothetical protein